MMASVLEAERHGGDAEQRQRAGQLALVADGRHRDAGRDA